MNRVLLTYSEKYAHKVAPYFAAARAVGLEPVEPGEEEYDAVILCGGNDIDPAHYGEEPHEKLGEIDAPRDVYELDVTWAALKRDIPILAICRGMQLLNVALGGTLIQHVDGHRDVSHEVQGTMGCFEVNSRHHQAIAELGEGLTVIARSGEIIEAVRMQSKRWVVGVQWHPEDLVDGHPVHKAIFQAMADTLKA